MINSVSSVSWPSPAPRPPVAGFCAPSLRHVCAVASRASRVGAFVGCVFRPSSRSGSGAVCVAVFSSARVARRFARFWLGAVGVLDRPASIAVRRSPAGWAVSIPVASPPPASAVPLPWRGAGAAAFWRALRDNEVMA